MHYDGPGNIPGAPGTGYGYEIRVEGRSSANPASEEEEAPVSAAATAKVLVAADWTTLL